VYSPPSTNPTEPVVSMVRGVPLINCMLPLDIAGDPVTSSPEITCDTLGAAVFLACNT
jgi:hypothetical protein